MHCSVSRTGQWRERETVREWKCLAAGQGDEMDRHDDTADPSIWTMRRREFAWRVCYFWTAGSRRVQLTLCLAELYWYESWDFLFSLLIPQAGSILLYVWRLFMSWNERRAKLRSEVLLRFHRRINDVKDWQAFLFMISCWKSRCFGGQNVPSRPL